jgi:hypothetical protein
MKNIKKFESFILENYEEEIIKDSDSDITRISKIENLMAQVRNSLVENSEINHIINDIENLKDKYYFCKEDIEKSDIINELKRLESQLKKETLLGKEKTIDTTKPSNFNKAITKIGFIISLLAALSCGPSTHRISGKYKELYKQQKHTADSLNKIHPKPGYGWK